jgi:hypothetical protein
MERVRHERAAVDPDRRPGLAVDLGEQEVVARKASRLQSGEAIELRKVRVARTPNRDALEFTHSLPPRARRHVPECGGRPS